MKNLLYAALMVAALVLFSPNFLDAQTSYPALSTEDYQPIHDRINQALENHNQYIIDLLANVGQSVPPIATRLELDKARQDLEVKRILADDFWGAEEFRSQRFKDEYFRVLEKRGISENDLLSLKRVLNEEIVEIEAWDLAQGPEE